MNTVTRLLVPLLLVASLGGCAILFPGADEDGPRSGPIRDAKVFVTNHNWSDMVIYVQSGGQRVRLGGVTSMSSETFMLPPSVASSTFWLVADPIGSRYTHTTQAITVGPGDTVEYQIQNQIEISTVSIWAEGE
jgi:hypothetical protein